MPRVTIVITGKVTRVGFRNFVKKKADELGLCGTVQNTRDKAVEMVVEGEDVLIKHLIQACARGPPRAKPKNVSVSRPGPEEGLTGFKILK